MAFDQIQLPRFWYGKWNKKATVNNDDNAINVVIAQCIANWPNTGQLAMTRAS